MPDSIIPTGDVEEAKAFIANLRFQIEGRTAELHEAILRIRDRAKQDERAAVERAHAEIEPLRRQMEAMIQSVAYGRKL
jgi:polyhydroxyalkanoate synthesis regulator phasin